MVAPPRPSSPSRRSVMRRTEPPPPPAPRTTEEAMRGTDPRSGFSRSDVDLAQRRGGDLLLAPLSTLTDEAKQTGALERGTPLSYGLTAASFLGDLFNPSVDIPVAAGFRGVQRALPAFRSPEARQAALMRRILNDPETYAATTRSADSMGDILSTGRFQSSRQTGRTGSGADVISRGSLDQYNPLREAAESAVWGPGVDNVQYAQLVSPVLRNQPRPLPIGQSGRAALQEYLDTAKALNARQTLKYGAGRGAEEGTKIPVQYVWSPDALRRSQLYYDDSLWNQAMNKGERLTKGFEDFVASFGGRGEGAGWLSRRQLNQNIGSGLEDTAGYIYDPIRKNWFASRTPGSYIEAQLPNLSLDDIARIDAVPSVPGSAEAIQQGLAASGRSIPTGTANILGDTAYQMPSSVFDTFRNGLNSPLDSIRRFLTNRPAELLTEYQPPPSSGFGRKRLPPAL